MGNYYLYKIAESLTATMPLPMSYGLATFLSDLQYFLSKTDRQAVESNLKIILNTKNVPASQVRDVFRYFGKYLADFFVMTKKIDKDFIKRSVNLSGIEHLNKALEKGKGGIIVGAHLGNWEMAGAVLSLMGYPLSAIALAHKDQRVNAFFNKRREFFGSSVIQTNVALRHCLGHLKRNRLVAILADRDFGQHGLVMDFLGQKTMMPRGAAVISLKTGCPIIPGFFLRNDNETFDFILKDPIYPPEIGCEHITDELVKALISKYLYLIEEQIRKHPSQWLMFRPFQIL